MARFSEYLDYEYLPGEVYSSGLSDYRLKPQTVIDYITNKRFKFDGDEDRGESFQNFLRLQANPNALVEAKMKFPQRFEDFMSLSSLGSNR